MSKKCIINVGDLVNSARSSRIAGTVLIYKDKFSGEEQYKNPGEEPRWGYDRTINVEIHTTHIMHRNGFTGKADVVAIRQNGWWRVYRQRNEAHEWRTVGRPVRGGKNLAALLLLLEDIAAEEVDINLLTIR